MTKKGLSTINAAFGQALNSDSANNLGHYSVLAGVKKHRKTVFSKGLTINGVSYDSNAHTVKISLAKPFKGAVQLTIHGGLATANGSTSSGDVSVIVK